MGVAGHRNVGVEPDDLHVQLHVGLLAARIVDDQSGGVVGVVGVGSVGHGR
jgi:glutamate/tyrosine decarboxylase-like PLP-dependent enzyme